MHIMKPKTLTPTDVSITHTQQERQRQRERLLQQANLGVLNFPLRGMSGKLILPCKDYPGIPKNIRSVRIQGGFLLCWLFRLKEGAAVG